MLPRIAIVDPVLTYDLPPAVTVATGMDALRQSIEPYVSARANPLTDGICLQRLRCAVRSLRRAYLEGMIATPAVTWHLQACAAAWRSPTPGLGPCMALPALLGVCMMLPMVRCAWPCCTGMRRHIRALLTRAPEHVSHGRRYGELAAILPAILLQGWKRRRMAATAVRRSPDPAAVARTVLPCRTHRR